LVNPLACAVYIFPLCTDKGCHNSFRKSEVSYLLKKKGLGVWSTDLKEWTAKTSRGVVWAHKIMYYLKINMVVFSFFNNVVNLQFICTFKFL
jgi:hypothetical protein